MGKFLAKNVLTRTVVLDTAVIIGLRLSGLGNRWRRQWRTQCLKRRNSRPEQRKAASPCASLEDCL